MINIIITVISGIVLWVFFCKIIPYNLPDLNPEDQVELNIYKGYIWISKNGKRIRRLVCKQNEFLGWATYDRLPSLKNKLKTYQDILDFEEKEKL